VSARVVIPAQAGIQLLLIYQKTLDPGLRRGDDLITFVVG